MSSFPLTEDQQAAYDACVDLLLDPEKTVLVLEGYAGTGKSTLVERFLNDLPKIQRTTNLLYSGSNTIYEVILTATTNKAAEALEHITNRYVRTIQSVLGLVVKKDYSTGISTLEPKKNAEHLTKKFLIIDEASFVDSDLLAQIFERTHDCKILFIGDPAQLAPVKSSRTPVFNAKLPTAKLTRVVRQAEGNPIVELATAFREMVATKKFFSFRPDGYHIQHLSEEDFHQAILADFGRKEWKHTESKVLAWTNKTVIKYNHFIREHAQGEPLLQPGDYAVCNHFTQLGKDSLKTDQLVQITDMDVTEYLAKINEEVHRVPGYFVTVDKMISGFMPADRLEAKNLAKVAKAAGMFDLVRTIESQWLDLRAAYACTINKSQGSTYDRVYIDLDDLKRCYAVDQLARLLYVAVSRARQHVYFKGDLA